MSNSDLSFERSELRFNNRTKDLGFPIHQVKRIGNQILVLFKFGVGYSDRMSKQNVALLTESGEILWWIADAPVPGEYRSYTAIHSTENGVEVDNETGFRFKLDMSSGAVKDAELVRFS